MQRSATTTTHGSDAEQPGDRAVHRLTGVQIARQPVRIVREPQLEHGGMRKRAQLVEEPAPRERKERTSPQWEVGAAATA